jgi:hypothetical protein
VRTLAAIAGRVGSAADEERIATRLTGILAHRKLAFRILLFLPRRRSRAGDDLGQPARPGPHRAPAPALRPARAALLARDVGVHAAHHGPARRGGRAVLCCAVRRLGSLGSPFQAYDAVVAAKKAAPDAPLLSRFRLAWDYARRQRQGAPYAGLRPARRQRDPVLRGRGATRRTWPVSTSTERSSPCRCSSTRRRTASACCSSRTAPFSTRCARAWARSTAAPRSMRPSTSSSSRCRGASSGTRTTWASKAKRRAARLPRRVLGTPRGVPAVRLEKKATLFATELKFLGRSEERHYHTTTHTLPRH